MAATAWGTNTTNDFLVTGAPGDQFDPAIADALGEGFGVAWTSASGVTVRFFDTVGAIDPLLGTMTVSDGLYGDSSEASVTRNAAMTAGGSTIGYAVAWEETSASNPSSPSILRGRYVGPSGVVGGEFSIAVQPGVAQHSAAMSGYGVDGANGRPLVDGFNVVWVSADPADVAGGALTQAQLDAGYGRIMLQRFEVLLDDRKAPTGPPQAAGLDGRAGAAGTDADAPANVAGAIGRDPSTIVTHDGETVITWIDTSNQVHVRVFDLAGSDLTGNITIAGGGSLDDIDGASLDTGAGVANGFDAKVVDLAGAGFVVAWVGQVTLNLPLPIGSVTVPAIRAVVFSPGAAAGTYTAGAPITLEFPPAGFTGEFSLGTLIDSGGFSLSYTVATPSGSDIFIKTFDSGGATDGVVSQLNTTTVGNQNAVAIAGLIGDRIVAVYQDDPTAASGDQDIRAAILDTRPAGQTIIGDDVATGRERPRADVLVGTIGNDTIEGRQDDDQLFGALGDDRMIGGAGADFLDGGGNGAGGDVAVYSGLQSNYVVTYLGADLFTIEDTRGGSPDGADTVRGIEFFEFSDGAGGVVLVSTADFIPVTGVTPTAWGLTDNDSDNAPDAAGTPDVDGFVVNHAAKSLAGDQTNPFVADSVGEFIGVVWESPGADGATHIKGQFYDVVLGFDEFMPNVVNLSDGIGLETNPVLVSGGANSGWGIAFEERDDALDATRVIRTNFQGPGFLTGVEQSVLDEGPNVDQHDAALSGSFLDRTLDSPVAGSVLPAGMNDGYNVAWISTHLDNGADGLSQADIDAGYGRVMFQRFEVPLDALGNPGAPVAGGIDGIAGLDNSFGTLDAAVWIRDEAGTGTGGAIGRNPSTAGTHGFETAVIWIEKDGAGGERVAGVIYDDLGQVIPVPGIDNISGNFPVVPGTVAHVVQAGAVNLGVVWVTADPASPSGFSIMGTMYAPTGTGLNGVGFGFAAPDPFVLAQLPSGIDIADLDFHATGISGEDSEDIIVSWTLNGDMMAQHVKVALDPVTGLVISMTPEGSQIVVNAETAGDQTNGTVAGLLGDRFIAVWEDSGAAYDNGIDIVARVIDTREPGQTIVGDLIRNGDVQARRDVLVGTVGDDIIRGDISDAGGLVDTIYGGMGDDVIFGGSGLRGAAGSPELIDGGEGFDTAVYSGRFTDYSITINGDGSYEVIDLRPVQDAQGNPLPHDGIDNLYSIERLHFLDSANGGAQELFITFGFPGTPPPLNHVNGIDQGPYDGTPVPWSLEDTSPFKEIAVDADPTPGTPEDAKSGISATNLQDGAALAWISGTHEVWAISYDTTGNPDPVLLAANTQLTDGTFADNTVSDIEIAMTAGLGFTAVWESTDGNGDDPLSEGTGDTSLHIRFASTNTHLVLDPAAGVPGPGLPGGEITVVGSDGAGIAVDPVIQGYEIVNVDNDTLEVGFHVGWVQKTNTSDAYGVLTLARYEIPVYDILVDAAGNPVLDAAGQGQLATDAAGNLIPSTAATFGIGSETAPVSIGLDGLRGTADDGAAIVLTNAGLLAANDPLVGSDADHAPIQGRDISVGSLHDGQLVVSYIGTDEQVHLKIFVPAVDETGDRETGGLGGVDVVATGITSYSELALPPSLTAGLGSVAVNQTQLVVPQQNGSFGVFWAADDGAGGVALQGIIYTGAGTNWAPSPVITFATGLSSGVNFQVAPTGVTPGGLEDGFFVSWEEGAGILGQRFDMEGNPVGQQVTVGDPTSGTPGLHSSAGLDDGLMLFGYEDENGSVSAQFLDTREPGVAIIGPRTGAPRDVLVGTVGDDALDGRALGDELYGGLGNDLITMGSGADIGFGGKGDDTIIGGTGQDQLLGGEGNDLLWGGLSGPPDPQVDRDLQAGLVAAGVDAAIIASDPGADIVSGGDGVDTISFQGEFGSFRIDLSTGIVLSDRANSGTFILEDVIGQIVDDGAGGTIFTFIPDVENATGGIGNDVITGTDGDNVLDGQGGSNIIDGRGGTDTVVLAANRADVLVAFDAATNTFSITNPLDSTTQTVRNVEFFQFLDGTLAAAGLIPGPSAVDDVTSTLEDVPVVIDVLANDNQGAQLTITAVDGTAIVANGPAVAIANGTVTLNGLGQLIFAPAANFFGSTAFSYTAQDGNGGFTTANVQVDVTNVNDAPTDIVFNGNPATSAISLAENSAAGTVVATLTTIDPDNTPAVSNDTFTYTLANSFGGRFEIVGNQIRVLNAALLDFETGPNAFTLSVTANDGHGGTRTEDVVVALADVNEAPADIVFNGNAATASASVGELSPANTVVATLTATDPDGGANGAGGISFSLADSADGRFAIIGNQIVLANPALIDFEDPTNPAHSYVLKVNATDAGGLSRTEAFTVNITNAPAGTGASQENVINGTAANNTLNGTAGNDVINGLGGRDTMNGGAGNDTYFVDNSGDRINENNNAGTDTVYVSGITSFTLGNNTENLIYTGAANGTSWRGNALSNTIAGGSGNDQIQGDAGNDHLIGNAGNDQIQGGDGNDLVFGGAGNDTLDGRNGNDRLNGGAGNDTLIGGNGNDTFVFASGFGSDIIQSFGDVNGNQDIIEFSKDVFADFTAVAAAMQQVGNDVVITDTGGNSLTLQRMTIAGLGADDFHFI